MALSLATNIVIISVIFGSLSTLSLLLRLWGRRKNVKSFGLDDLFIIPGTLAALVLCVMQILAVYGGGLGTHFETTPDGMPVHPARLSFFFKMEFAIQLLSVFALCFTKISIIFFYRRIFESNDTFRVVAWVLFCLVACWGITFFFATLFECYPVSAVWTTTFGEPGRPCYNYIPMFYATAVSNFIIDVAILGAPQPLVWKLKLPFRVRIGVSLLFLLGAFVCGVSIARIVFFFEHNYNDVTYGIAPTLYWSQLEACVAVLCANLPAMSSAFKSASDCFTRIFRRVVSVSPGSVSMQDRGTHRSRITCTPANDPIGLYLRDGQASSKASASGSPVLDYDDLPNVYFLKDCAIGVRTTVTSAEEKV